MGLSVLGGRGGDEFIKRWADPKCHLTFIYVESCYLKIFILKVVILNFFILKVVIHVIRLISTLQWQEWKPSIFWPSLETLDPILYKYTFDPILYKYTFDPFSSMKPKIYEWYKSTNHNTLSYLIFSSLCYPTISFLILSTYYPPSTQLLSTYQYHPLYYPPTTLLPSTYYPPPRETKSLFIPDQRDTPPQRHIWHLYSVTMRG